MSNVIQLSSDEIALIGGAASEYETCVVTWTGIGTFMGAVLGAGAGAAIGAVVGTWYGTHACDTLER